MLCHRLDYGSRGNGVKPELPSIFTLSTLWIVLVNCLHHRTLHVDVVYELLGTYRFFFEKSSIKNIVFILPLQQIEEDLPLRFKKNHWLTFGSAINIARKLSVCTQFLSKTIKNCTLIRDCSCTINNKMFFMSANLVYKYELRF